MNETGLFALIGIAGLALIVRGIDSALRRRRTVKRLMNIVMAERSAWEQERREA